MIRDHWPVWVVLRDGKLWRIYKRRETARDGLKLFKPGSKHKWRVVKALIKTDEHSR